MELFCFSFPLFQLVKQENEKVSIWWTRQHGWLQRVFICSSLGTFYQKCILCSEMSSLEKFFFSWEVGFLLDRERAWALALYQTIITFLLLLLLTRLKIKPRKILPFSRFDSFSTQFSIDIYPLISRPPSPEHKTFPKFQCYVVFPAFNFFFFFARCSTPKFFPPKTHKHELPQNPHRRVIKLEIPPH